MTTPKQQSGTPRVVQYFRNFGAAKYSVSMDLSVYLSTSSTSSIQSKAVKGAGRTVGVSV